MSLYTIVYTDEGGDTILPDDETLPRVLFTSLKEAEELAKQWIKTFDHHRLTLYGEAYPFDQTTLENEMSTKGHAPVGWFRVQDEDGDWMNYTVQIIIMRVKQA